MSLNLLDERIYVASDFLIEPSEPRDSKVEKDSSSPAAFQHQSPIDNAQISGRDRDRELPRREDSGDCTPPLIQQRGSLITG